MLLVQHYLETHSFADLIRDHGVYASFAKNGRKFSLNYDQLEAKDSDPLSQECRGLILCCSDGLSLKDKAIEINGKLNYNNICLGKTKIMAFPMKRFFNHGQGSAASIDFKDSNLQFLEKLDGTLTILYYDFLEKQWCVATRSVPDADLVIDYGSFTFRTLFEKALRDCSGSSFDKFTSMLDKDNTYCFELTTPYNRIVVKYDIAEITLIAVRSLSSLKEIDPNIFDIYIRVEHGHDLKIKCVRSYNFNSINEVLKWVHEQSPIEHEGLVVRDSEFNRIKIKNAAYIVYNKIRDSLASSRRGRLELILAEKEDDVLAMFAPEIANDILLLKGKVQQLVKDYDKAYEAIIMSLSSPTKKDFALALQQRKDLWQAPLFSRFNNKSSSMKDFIIKNKTEEGTWGSNFLDKILDLI